jgi:uncharacterized membrane protein YbhN (UPF0104 family)
VILAVLVWRLGTGPFLDGVRLISARSLLAATAITALTTVCAAWRWRSVARGLGVGLPLGTAISAYYRSQFLNSALPGGVLGDVHRGVRHGLDAGNLGRGLRAVAWERAAGQVVFVGLALLTLLVLRSPVQAVIGRATVVAVLGALCAALLLRALPHRGSSRRARVVRAARADIRHGLTGRRVWPVVTFSSLVVAAGHSGTFLIAAATTGSAGSPARLLPLAMIVLLAAAVPLNVGGWGPREGMAAWAFAGAGLGADQGVATAAAYGVMGLVATLPGAVVLIAERSRTRDHADTRADTAGIPGVPVPPLPQPRAACRDVEADQDVVADQVHRPVDQPDAISDAVDPERADGLDTCTDDRG